MTGLFNELENLDVALLIEYGVAEADKPAALAAYKRYKDNPVAVRLLHGYYAELPDAREEPAVDCKIVAEKQGAVLAVVQTPGHAYLYLVADEQVLYLDALAAGVEDASILNHFDFDNIDEFRKTVGDNPDTLPSLDSVEQDAATCVACGVGVGEHHMLGCPVEQCPWCDGQLSGCNCRFDQLGVAGIETEEQLDRFEELLEAKGRIPFKAEHNPSYPTAGDDPAPFDHEEK